MPFSFFTTLYNDFAYVEAMAEKTKTEQETPESVEEASSPGAIGNSAPLTLTPDRRTKDR